MISPVAVSSAPAANAVGGRGDVTAGDATGEADGAIELVGDGAVSRPPTATATSPTATAATTSTLTSGPRRSLPTAPCASNSRGSPMSSPGCEPHHDDPPRR